MRRVFACALGFLAIQVATTALWSEPYPAIAMPGFPGTRTDAEGFFRAQSLDVVVEFEDGGRGTVTPQRLLEPAPGSHTIAIARWMFGPVVPRHRAAARDPSWERWLKVHVFPARELQNRMFYEGYVHPDTVAWLRGRVAAIFPGRPARRVRFEWYDDRTRVEDGRVQRMRTLSGLREIELTDG